MSSSTKRSMVSVAKRSTKKKRSESLKEAPTINGIEVPESRRHYFDISSPYPEAMLRAEPSKKVLVPIDKGLLRSLRDLSEEIEKMKAADARNKDLRQPYAKLSLATMKMLDERSALRAQILLAVEDFEV